MAVMSMRGTMMSAALSSCSFRILTSSVRSCGSIGCSSLCSSISSSSSSRKLVSPLRGRVRYLSQLRSTWNGPSASPGGRLAEVSAMRSPERAIGIWHSQLRQDGDLASLHLRRLGRGRVIEAQKMQHSVHNEVAKMIRERLTLRCRLRRDGLESEHDVTQEPRRSFGKCHIERREGQHVG